MNEVCRLSATRIPKNTGSMPKTSSSGRKIGTKMMMISLHSNGQPSRKIMSCARIRNDTVGFIKPPNDKSMLVTNSLMTSWPPR